MNTEATTSALALLPPELRLAQEAIALPEVQELMRQLAKYNLGVCMPHRHDPGDGSFSQLPADIVQVETDLQVSFAKRGEESLVRALPVAWRWEEHGPVGMAVCVQSCTVVTLQSGGEWHKTHHDKVK